MATIVTPLEIRQDDNFLCGLVTEHLPPVLLYLVYTGTDMVKYYLFVGDELIFEAKDYKPSPLYDYDSIESALALMKFLCVRPGDTDKEYFKDYTPKQFEFLDSCMVDEIRQWVDDYGNGEVDEVEGIDNKTVAKEVINKWFTQD